MAIQTARIRSSRSLGRVAGAPVLAMGRVAETGPVIGQGRSGTGFFGRGGYVRGAAPPGNPMGFERGPTGEVDTEGAEGQASPWHGPEWGEFCSSAVTGLWIHPTPAG